MYYDLGVMKFYRIYNKNIRRFQHSKILFRWIFGFSPSSAVWGQYWDWATISLRKCLLRHSMPQMHILDMGCGPYGVLSRFAHGRLSPASITAVDHCPELVAFANEHDPDSGIQYMYSDLFSAVQDKYDLIVFNAPYLVLEKGERLGLIPDALSRKRFCGGIDGCDTIRRFLSECPKHLQENGIVLLGVNHFHVGLGVLHAAISQSGLKPVRISSNPISNVCVYVLKERCNA